MRFVPLFQELALVVWCLSLVTVGAASYWLPGAARRTASKAPVLRTLALWLAGITVLFGIGALAISLLLVHRGSSRGTVTAVTWLVAATLVPGAFVTATISLILRSTETLAHRSDAGGRASRTMVDRLTGLLRRRSGNVRVS